MDDQDWQRIARYHAGEGTREEIMEIQRWLESDPALSRAAESMRAMWDLSATIPPAHGGDAKRVWQRISREAGLAPAAASEPLHAPRASARTAHRRRSWRAASVVGIAAMALLALIPLARGLGSRMELPGAGATEMREYVAGVNERLRLTLPDSSVVELASGSRLRVPASFAAERREVRLEGTALFSVAADPERPFLVRAGDAVTRVLGTEFVVRSYPGEDGVGVAVLQGKVALASSGAVRETVLLSGQVGRVASDGRTTVTRSRAEFSRLVRGASGRLEFVDRPLAEVLAQLELWYGVEIVLTDGDLSARPVSTVVESDSLNHVLDMLALVVDAHYEQSGDTITFSSR